MVLNFSNFNMQKMMGCGSMISGYGSNSGYSSYSCGNSIFGSILGGVSALGKGYNMVSGLFGGGYGSMIGGLFSGGGCGSLLKGVTTLIGSGISNFAPIAGFGVGFTVLKAAGSILSNVITNAKQNSYKTLNSNANSISAQIQAEAAKLGCKDTEQALNYELEVSYDDNITTAEFQLNSAKKNVTKLSNDATILNKQLNSLKDALTEENRATLEPQIVAKTEELEAKQKELKAEQAKIAQDGELTKKLAAAVQAKADRMTEINTIQARITQLQSHLEVAEDRLADKVFDKANGTELSRVSPEKLQSKFNGTQLKSGANITKRDLRAAVLNYQAARTDEEREFSKAQFLAIWNDLGENEKDSKFLQMSYDLITA